MTDPKITPRLRMEAVEADGSRATARGLDVANLAPIHVKISLRDAHHLVMTPLGDDGALVLEAERRDRDPPEPAPCDVQMKQVMERDDVQIALVTLFITEDPALRKERVRQKMMKSMEESQKRGNVGEHFAAEVRQNYDQMAGFLESMLLENDVGTYQLTAVYKSAGEGVWNGELRSNPLLVQVTYEGDPLGEASR